jgi:L-fucose mutarotase
MKIKFTNLLHKGKESNLMLKGIPSIIGPELLKVLCEMGHTDELTIGDGNFPGHTYGQKVIRMDGHGIPEILDAILKLFPLDTYVAHPAALMGVVPGDTCQTPIWDTYKEIVAKYDDRGSDCFEELQKPDFYERTKKHSSVVIMTGEKALYANIILKKGVVTTPE